MATKDKMTPRHDVEAGKQKREPSAFVGFDEGAGDEETIHATLDIYEDVAEAQALPLTPVPLPVFARSGLYVYSRQINLPVAPVPIRTRLPIPQPGPRVEQAEAEEEVYDDDVNAIALYQREEVRVDVDGRYPQMAISGTRSGFLTVAAHWIASVAKTAPGTYEGPIWYKDGAAGAVPHTKIKAVVTGGIFPSTRKLEITFSGGGAASFVRSYAYESAYHRKVEFEYDTVAGATAVTSINTHAHPNRPASLANESLSLATVYRRAGFNVSMSGGNSVIPLAAAGANARWSDQEMHDAMQVHWSRFANKPQWSLWVLFAALHEQGTSLGGIMFDDIGPNHRQGTAIFSDAFIANPPPGDAAPAAWVARMRFWTAVHEMGHAFNLAHAWQKAASPQLPGNPWIPLQNDDEARSFMNYPFRVSGGQAAFFANFAYRFINPELLFMRHAPSRFVQMGNEAWFTNHGFREASEQSNPDYELRLSTSLPGNRFAYLAPPVIEVALTNASGRAKLVSGERIAEREGLTLIINPERGEPRRWQPYLRHCGEGDELLLQPGEALYDSIMVGAGKNGWDMADPGRYTIQAVLMVDGKPVYSNQLCVTVEHPASRDEERFAGDMFTPEVGQVLSVNGSRALGDVRYTLENALAMKENPVSKLAAAALATPLAYEYKLLEIGDAVSVGERDVADQRIDVGGAKPAEAKRILKEGADGKADELVNAMGHARYLREAPKIAAATGPGLAGDSVDTSTDALRSGVSADALPVSDAVEATLRRKAASLSR